MRKIKRKTDERKEVTKEKRRLKKKKETEYDVRSGIFYISVKKNEVLKGEGCSWERGNRRGREMMRNTKYKASRRKIIKKKRYKDSITK